MKFSISAKDISITIEGDGEGLDAICKTVAATVPDTPVSVEIDSDPAPEPAPEEEPEPKKPAKKKAAKKRSAKKKAPKKPTTEPPAVVPEPAAAAEPEPAPAAPEPPAAPAPEAPVEPPSVPGNIVKDVMAWVQQPGLSPNEASIRKEAVKTTLEAFGIPAIINLQPEHWSDFMVMARQYEANKLTTGG